MDLSVDIIEGFGKLDKFTFTVDNPSSDNLIMDFGDGSHSDFIVVDANTLTASHVYGEFGNYNACVRECDENGLSTGGDSVSCEEIIVIPYVGNVIEFTEYPSDGFSSEVDGNNFSIALSANAPPPIRVKLSVDGTISIPHEEIDPTNPIYVPNHYFYSDREIEDGIITLDDPAKIIVNGEILGYRDVINFGYYDDYHGEFDINVNMILGDC